MFCRGMKLKSSQITNEDEAYDQILEFFHRKDRNPFLTEIWKDQTYVNLMSFLEQNLENHVRLRNYKLVQNAIILILSLFHNLPPDRFNYVGRDVHSMSEQEKFNVLSMLKEEFLD